MHEFGTIINASGSANKKAFLDALKKALNDVYQKDITTNIHSFYSVLAEQFADFDIQVQRLENDQWLKAIKKNEYIQRSYSRLDRVAEEGAFNLTYIGFVQEGSKVIKKVPLSTADTYIQLEILPASTAITDFSLTLETTDYSDLILGYITEKNQLSISSVPKGAVYTLSYTDAGCTRAQRDTPDLTRNEQGHLECSLSGTNVLYDSERVYIHNSAIGVLTRDIDYSINYPKGIITALPGGRIEIFQPESLEVTFSYRFDFLNKVTDAFHKQIYGEVARFVDPVTLEINSSNISEVFRVYNATQRIQLYPTAVSRNRITLNNIDAIRLEKRIEQPAIENSAILNAGIVDKTFAISVPNGEGSNSIQTVSDVVAASLPVRLIEGKRQNIPDSLTVETLFESKELNLYTGGLDAYHCNIVLQSGRDYVIRTASPTTFVITLLEAGRVLVGKNSLYARFFAQLTPFNEKNVPEVREHRFSATVTPPKQVYPINGSSIFLTEARTYVQPSNSGDIRVKEQLFITDEAETIVYKENLDYTYDGTNKVIQLTNGSRISSRNNVNIYFAGAYQILLSYTTTPDVILVDYDKTQNSIDWSRSIESYQLRFRTRLSPDVDLINLLYQPDDVEDLSKIIVRSVSDSSLVLKPISYDIEQRTLRVQAPTLEDEFVVSYIGNKHAVYPSTDYYVSYEYGARDRSLRQVWSPLLNLTETTRRRYEEKLLNGGQSSLRLDYSPTDLSQIVIFEKGQTESEPATTILSYDVENGFLYFTPVRSYGVYVVAYNTQNALTEDLRKFVIGMIGAFLTGPTKTGIEKMIETFTGIIPDVRVATALAFKLANEWEAANPDTRSDRLNDVGFLAINPAFVPSRFNNGFQSTVIGNTNLFAPAITNVRDLEGTIQFLIGPRFNGDDGLTKYFIDIGIPNQYYQNRMAIYKNQNGYLVFETHDKYGKIWRVASSIERSRTKLYKFLTTGTTSLKLDVRPSFITTDIDNDGQFDFFGAHKTEFIIRRVAGEPTKEGYGYSSNSGYGYVGGLDSVTISAPLNLCVHFQIPENPELLKQTEFDAVTRKLQALALAICKKAGGKLVVHASPSYIEANTVFSNVLGYLQSEEGGNVEIGLYLDAPTIFAERIEKVEFFKAALTQASTLGLKIQTCSPSIKVKEWALIAKELKLLSVLGYVDPFFGESFTNKQPNVRRTRVSSTLGLLDLQAGELIYLPGVTDLKFSQPVSPLTLQQIESTLHRSLRMLDVNKVNSWYITLTPTDFTTDYLNETKLFVNWIKTVIQPLVLLKKVQWVNPTDTVNLFVALESWLNTLSATDRNIVDRGMSIKPLKYDYDTKTITFEPIPSDGVYEFDYVTGWAAYEESEIFVAAVYKFRTDDGTLPYYKLYLNGELQDFITFADFPPPGEG